MVRMAARRVGRTAALCLAAAFLAAADAAAVNRAVSEEPGEEAALSGSFARSNLWLRVICGKSNPSAALAIFIRHGHRPYYQFASVTRQGLKPGAVPPGGRKAWLEPGAVTPWMDYSSFLGERGLERVMMRMIRGYDNPTESSEFTVEFAGAPDGSSPRGKIVRKAAPAAGFTATLDPTKRNVVVECDLDASAKTRRIVEALPPVEGRRPVAFPVGAGLALNRNIVDPHTWENEMAVFRRVGLNSVHYAAEGLNWAREGFTPGFAGDGEMLHPDREKLLERARKWLAKRPAFPAGGRSLYVNCADEPGVSMTHVTNCALCLKSVPGGATCDKTEGVRFYRSAKKMTSLFTGSFQAITDALTAVDPSVRTGVNQGIGLVFSGNLVGHGSDWFDIYGSGALTYGWCEDWANFGRTKQINSIYFDTMRSACSIRGIPFGVYCILCGCNEWLIACKAYMALGRGAKSLYFFNYGPRYAPSSDYNSHRPEIFAPIRHFAYSVGEYEKDILAAECAKGDAAILVGVTGDIWQIGEDSEYGMERSALSLLLRHCNVRTDVLGENAVKKELPHYRMLFVTDRNVRSDVAREILAWVRRGGTLCLGPNAMTADEADRPLDTALPRPDYVKRQKVGRPKFELVKRLVYDSFEGMEVIVGSAKPYWNTLRVGKGEVRMFGFFPGLDYWKRGEADEKSFGLLKFPDAHRAFFKREVLKGVRRRAVTSDPLVEISLLEGPRADVLVFSNWNGMPRDVRFAVRDVAAYARVETVNAVISDLKISAGSVAGKIKLDGGAVVRCVKR